MFVCSLDSPGPPGNARPRINWICDADYSFLQIHTILLNHTIPAIRHNKHIMTTKPGASHFVHSGFVDLATLIASTPSRLIGQSRLWASSQPYNAILRPTGDWEYAGMPYASDGVKEVMDPMFRDSKTMRGGTAGRGGKASGLGRGGKVGMRNGELRHRKVDKRTIGHPTDFR